MYNTQFKVKYHDIEQELIYKLKNKTIEDTNDTLDEEYEYTCNDILNICSKLYKDELLSAFCIDDLDNDKLNKAMTYVYDIITLNEQFKSIINDMSQFFKSETNDNKQYTESINNVMFMSLFSQTTFYITHQCICQQIEQGTISNDLLVKLRQHSVNLLQNHFDIPLEKI